MKASQISRLLTNISRQLLMVGAFLFSGINLEVYAQQFSQLLSSTDTLEVYKYDVIRSNENSTLVLTNIYPSLNFRNTISLIQINRQGQWQRAFRYESQDSNRSISSSKVISLYNGDFIVAGSYSINNTHPSYPFFMSVDSSGQINWAKQLNTAGLSEGSLFMQELADSSILCQLRYNNGSNHNLLFRFNSAGQFSTFYEQNLTFSNALTLNANPNSFEMLLSDGNYLKISNDLQQLIWQRKYMQAIGIQISKASNGDYLLASAQVAFPGHMTISRLDSTGTIIWSSYAEFHEAITNNEFDIVRFHFIAEDSQGNIIVCANSDGGLNGSLFAVFDAQGNYISNRKTNSFYDKFNIPENQSILYGGFANHSKLNTGNFAINSHHLDSTIDCFQSYVPTLSSGTQGILTPDTFFLSPVNGISAQAIAINQSPLSISQQNHCNLIASNPHINAEEIELSLFPNPVKDLLTINSPLTFQKLRLYNIHGQLLLETTSENIDFSPFENGVYFIQMQLANQLISRKVVKQ
tara:strand:- start:1206 stop:2774 length:1569 start_codon:yes stop_codon:yes gene_type:complete